MSVLNEKQNPILPANIEKIKFFALNGKQSLVPLERGLQ